jgi:hypothetical protein
MQLSTGRDSFFLETNDKLEKEIIMSFVGKTCAVFKDSDNRIEIMQLRPSKPKEIAEAVEAADVNDKTK